LGIDHIFLQKRLNKETGNLSFYSSHMALVTSIRLDELLAFQPNFRARENVDSNLCYLSPQQNPRGQVKTAVVAHISWIMGLLKFTSSLKCLL